MDAADVAVPTSEGGTLAARFFWPRDLRVSRTAKGLPALLAAASNGAATLLVHQYSVMGGSQELMRGIARELAFRQGCVAVTFDLRGVGGSSGRCTLTGHGEADDVETMGKWLQEEGFSRILLLCTSAGAPIGGSALDRVPAFTGCAVCAVCRGRTPCVRACGGVRALRARAFCALPLQLRRAGLRLRLLGFHPVFGPLPRGAGLAQAEAVHPGAPPAPQCGAAWPCGVRWDPACALTSWRRGTRAGLAGRVHCPVQAAGGACARPGRGGAAAAFKQLLCRHEALFSHR